MEAEQEGERPLPAELVDHILLFLPPFEALALGHLLRRAFVERTARRRLATGGNTRREVDQASAQGHLHLLRAWRPTRVNLYWTKTAIDLASANGHVHVLEWWKRESGRELRWSALAMDLASANGHVHVLDWWAASDLDLRYTDLAVDLASENGCGDVVQWWLRKAAPKATSSAQANQAQALQLRYSANALTMASKNGHVHILQMFRDAGVEIKISMRAIHHAHESGHNAVLAWWAHTGLPVAEPSSIGVVRAFLPGAGRTERVAVRRTGAESPTAVRLCERRATSALVSYWTALSSKRTSCAMAYKDAPGLSRSYSPIE